MGSLITAVSLPPKFRALRRRPPTNNTVPQHAAEQRFFACSPGPRPTGTLVLSRRRHIRAGEAEGLPRSTSSKPSEGRGQAEAAFHAIDESQHTIQGSLSQP